jgi:hypothetical protein
MGVSSLYNNEWNKGGWTQTTGDWEEKASAFGVNASHTYLSAKAAKFGYTLIWDIPKNNSNSTYLALPLPSSFTDSLSANWSTKEWDIGDRNIRQTQTAGNNHPGFQSPPSMHDLRAGSAVATFDNVRKASEEGYAAHLSNVVGVAPNANEAAVFTGHSLESFTMSFTIVPLSEDEYRSFAKAIKFLITESTARLESNKAYWNVPVSFKMKMLGPSTADTGFFSKTGQFLLNPLSTMARTIIDKATNEQKLRAGGVEAGKVALGKPVEFYSRPPFKIKKISTNFTDTGLMKFHHKNAELTSYSVEIECMDAQMIERTHREDNLFLGVGKI